ncbi:thiol reductant ABC exporter subunit CydC [Oleiagrimonas sp. MCCC 1A03011]|uniref:thiol reductant ABC exporter subunit CydC n=1 Tax=Oleiagrimonas sp. MCCC 1A03011 TaxID=1926883 RepID=UPI000DC562CB|nr:thiol reductant ABC exporter subunit CydC [Oleiagrimonas sp. MCCC 1A03011]RAP56258.1 thiol reductant ABC exporter subunit CydC [Oleiagrimonas sp. MCCC 1A03011]
MSASVTGPLRRFWRVLGSQRRWMMLGVLVSLISTLAGIALMAIAGHFIASMALAGATGAVLNYYTPAALIRAMALLRTGGRYVERLVNHEATLRVLSRLRLWLFDRLLPLAPARTGFLGSADLFSRLRADVDRLEHAYLGIGIPIVVALLALPLVLAVQAAYAWPVAVLTAVAATAAAVLLPRWLIVRSRAPSEAMVRDEAALRAEVGDLVRGAAELRLYGADAVREARIHALTDAQQMRLARLDALQERGQSLIPLLAQAVAAGTLLLGAAAARADRLAGPDVVMLVLLGMAAFEVLAVLPEAFTRWGATRAAAARVFELVDAEPAVEDPAESAKPPSQPDISLRGVRLRYAEDAPWALDGVDLELPFGSRVAVTGASGAGKSSLAAALLRFQPFEGGRIMWGGRSITDYATDDVRAAIAVVEQRTHLFDATLIENLRVARPDATRAQIEAAVHAAQLSECVAALPDGYDTWLGEGGAHLSGGEARRVAIARALLADRPILLLDEPTEGLDAATAQSLMGALATLAEGRTVLLITHRLEGLSYLVDRRVRMERGRIVADEAVASVSVASCSDRFSTTH